MDIAASAPLPALRPDLRLFDGGRDATGEPTFLIFDAVRHRYFHIGWHAFAMLARWGRKTRRELQDSIRADLDIEIEEGEIEGLIRFLDTQELTVDGVNTGWRRNLVLAAMRRTGPAKWLLHNYLYFRVPLLRPDRWLSRVSHHAAFVFGKTFWLCWLVLTLLAVYLATREWADFAGAWHRVFDIQGLLAFAGGLIVLKSIHELGHALVAKRLGCRIASMGIVFMVLAPILYTDTTDCWRLPSRLQRWRIASAGVLAELMVAPVALLVWSFMTTGFARDLFFAAAVLAPALSLLVNLNPLMRFDGYFMLSDLLGVYNLQPRSFAYGRWKLRETLFAHGAPPPENLPQPLARLLIVYAYATWIYRLLLFVAIAVFVYAFIVKVVGILLFIVEIGFFVARPVVAELAVWWRMRRQARLRPKSVLAWGGLLVLLVAFVLPWRTTITIPAVVEAGRLEAIHVPAPAQIVEVLVRDGETVSAGQPLVRLQAPDLESLATISRRRITLLELRLARIAGSTIDLEDRLVAEQELQSERQSLAGIERLRQDLVVKAAADGLIRDLDRKLQTGQWIGMRDQVAMLVDAHTLRLRGLVSLADVRRLKEGMTGSFIADDGVAELATVRLESINRAADRRVSIPVLAEPHGGRVEAVVDDKKAIYSHEAMFSVRLTLESGEKVGHLLRGVVVIDGEPESFAMRLLRRVSQVLIRESGF